MNSLKLNLFDTAIFAHTPSRTGVTRPVALSQPAPLWRQSLAEMDGASTTRAHRAAQICLAVLGTLTAGSVVVAAGTLIRCLGAHQGLHSAVQTLMAR